MIICGPLFSHCIPNELCVGLVLLPVILMKIILVTRQSPVCSYSPPNIFSSNGEFCFSFKGSVQHSCLILKVLLLQVYHQFVTRVINDILGTRSRMLINQITGFLSCCFQIKYSSSCQPSYRLNNTQL